MKENYRAQQQIALSPEDTLTTTSAGAVIKLKGLVKQSLVSETRKVLQSISNYINDIYKGRASLFVFEELFGTKNTIYLLFQVETLQDYYDIMQIDMNCGPLRTIINDKISGIVNDWSELFESGTLASQTLLPQFRRMYGANDSGTEMTFQKPLTGLPPAFHQFTLPLENIIHSGNAGLMIHREAQLKYEFRSEGRQFARDVVDSINTKARGEATAFLYEEAFGNADKIHWLIHMDKIDSYYPLIQIHAADPEVRELYFKETLPKEKGGGNWSKMFVEGSMKDNSFVPQIW